MDISSLRVGSPRLSLAVSDSHRNTQGAMSQKPPSPPPPRRRRRALVPGALCSVCVGGGAVRREHSAGRYARRSQQEDCVLARHLG